jgi:hypothetical protein
MRNKSGFTAARLITATVLLVALAPLPYSYYTLTRFSCCVVAGYGAHLASERKQQPWMWAFGTTALLFNPFVPVRLDRTTWAVFDVAAAVLMLWSITNHSFVLDSEKRPSVSRNSTGPSVEHSAKARGRNPRSLT